MARKTGPKPMNVDSKSFLIAACLRADVALSASYIASKVGGLDTRQVQRLIWGMREKGCAAVGPKRGTWLITNKGKVLMERAVERFEAEAAMRGEKKRKEKINKMFPTVTCDKCQGTGEIPTHLFQTKEPRNV